MVAAGHGIPGKARQLLLLLLVGWWVACNQPVGYDASPPDAAPAPDSTCPLPTGQSYVVSSIALAPSDVGVDLDGDGEIENMIGHMPASILASASQALQDSVNDGGVIIIVYVVGWDFPSPSDPELRIYLFTGEDADQPYDPTNNTSGTGEFWVPDDRFDIDCGLENPGAATLVDGKLSADPPTVELPLMVGSGGMASFLDNHLECQFDERFTHFSCLIGGFLPLCELSSVPFPGDIAGSFLDALINDEAIRSSVNVDYDDDGDGLEQVVGDGVTVMKCVDGNGDQIEARDCPCHPDIRDGYSYAIRFEGVPAIIVPGRAN